MNQIDILIEGYATVTDTGWVASGTTTLITVHLNGSQESQSIQKDASVVLENEKKESIHILVDPGANREKLLAALDKKCLQTDAIEYIFLTHFHLDHSLLMGIFSKSKIINFEAITFGEKGELVPALIPGTDISIIKTPGHEYAGACLLVPTKEGTVAIVGDVFWFEDGQEQALDINKKDDFATDMQALIKSRKEILSLADWIVPGHGKIMKIERGSTSTQS